MIEDAFYALRHLPTAPFRAVFVKTFVLTLVLLGLVFAGLEKLAASAFALPYPWLATALSVLTGIGLLVGLVFAVVPVSFVVAGFFFDDLADVVEADGNPGGPFGRRLPLLQGLWIGLKFAGVALLVNAVALVLLLVPVVNVAAFFLANAYLLGRGYFELAALRYRPLDDVRRMRRAHGPRIFVAGLVMAGFASVPFANLVTPLFGAAFTVLLHRRLSREAASRGALQTVR